MTQRDGTGTEEGSGWGTRVYLWRIHVDIWQNQYNIVKLKNKIRKKSRFYYYYPGGGGDIKIFFINDSNRISLDTEVLNANTYRKQV